MGDRKMNSADLANKSPQKNNLKDFYSAPPDITSDECVWCLNGSYDEIDYIEEKLSSEGRYMASKMGVRMRNRYNKPKCRECADSQQNFNFDNVVENILKDEDNDVCIQSCVDSYSQSKNSIEPPCLSQSDKQNDLEEESYLESSTEELKKTLSVPIVYNEICKPENKDQLEKLTSGYEKNDAVDDKKAAQNDEDNEHKSFKTAKNFSNEVTETSNLETNGTKSQNAEQKDDDSAIEEIINAYSKPKSSENLNSESKCCFKNPNFKRQSRLLGVKGYDILSRDYNFGDGYYVINKITEKGQSITEESPKKQYKKYESSEDTSLQDHLDLVLKINDEENSVDKGYNSSYMNCDANDCEILSDVELEELQNKRRSSAKETPTYKKTLAREAIKLDTLQFSGLPDEEEIHQTILSNLPSDIENESKVLREVESDIEMRMRKTPSIDSIENQVTSYSANLQHNSAKKTPVHINTLFTANLKDPSNIVMRKEVEIEIESEIERLTNSSLSVIEQNIQNINRSSPKSTFNKANENGGICNEPELQREETRKLKLIVPPTSDTMKNVSLINPDFLQEIRNSHQVDIKINVHEINQDGTEVKYEVQNPKPAQETTPKKNMIDSTTSSQGLRKFDELPTATQKAKVQKIKKEAEERLDNNSYYPQCSPQSLKYVKRFVVPNKDKESMMDDVIAINDLKSDTIYGKIEKRGSNDLYQKNWFQLKDYYLVCYNGKKNKKTAETRLDEKNGEVICPNDNQYYLTKKYTINLRCSTLHLVLKPHDPSILFTRLKCKIFKKKKNEEIVHLYDKNIKNVIKIGDFYKVYVKNADGSEAVYSVFYLELAVRTGDNTYHLRFDTISNFLKWNLAFELRQQKMNWPII